MKIPVDVWLRGTDFAQTTSFDGPVCPATEWTDDDARRVLEGMLRAMERQKHPDGSGPSIALRGLSWIVNPYEEGGVVIAIEITLGAAIAGPFDIDRGSLEAMITRALAPRGAPLVDKRALMGARQLKYLRKAVLVVLIVSGLGWLFLRTVRETNAEPYTIDGEDLSGWTLALEAPELGGPGVLVLQPPVGMPAELFRQIFLRSGLSMAGPSRPSMPIVLRSEYGKDVAAVLSPVQMLEAARATGLERERLEPRCMVIRQGSRSQRFFVIFESPGFARVREELERLLQTRGASGFDPAALRPILAVASTEPDFDRWVWPLPVNPDTDCGAPIALTGGK